LTGDHDREGRMLYREPTVCRRKVKRLIWYSSEGPRGQRQTSRTRIQIKLIHVLKGGGRKGETTSCFLREEPRRRASSKNVMRGKGDESPGKERDSKEETTPPNGETIQPLRSARRRKKGPKKESGGEGSGRIEGVPEKN